VKEGKSRRTAAFWLFGLGGVLITAAIIALYTPWLPIFDLRQISILGNRQTPANEIVEALNLSRGDPLPSISVRAAASRVSSLPWIKSVRVSRAYPHGLRIVVTERVPVARLAYGPSGCLLLGEGGVVVSEQCTGESGLPLVTGARVTGEAAGERLLDPEIAELLDAFRGADWLGVTLREIKVTGAERMAELTCESGLRILLGALEVAGERVVYLKALCRSIDVNEYELIDLRYRGEATLVPRVRR
jgi:cell division septal protein FtsQ